MLGSLFLNIRKEVLDIRKKVVKYSLLRKKVNNFNNFANTIVLYLLPNIYKEEFGFLEKESIL
jgi:hypothetical protein